MPDKYVCDCGFSSNEFIEVCPECGFPITVIDIEDEVEAVASEKYSASDLGGPEGSEATDDEDATPIKIPHRKAA